MLSLSLRFHSDLRFDLGFIILLSKWLCLCMQFFIFFYFFFCVYEIYLFVNLIFDNYALILLDTH